MTIAAVLLAWILIGAVVGLYESRRGHWQWMWLLGAAAGPFSLPLFRQIEQNERLARPIELTPSTRQGHQGIRVLAGIDGSDESIEAARRAADLLGNRLADLTLATVADFEIQETVSGPLSPTEPWDATHKSTLETSAAVLSEWLGFEPGTVLLSGRPATALHTFANSEGHDLLIVGSRGRGLSKRVLGSCATGLTQESSVPVIVMPRRTAESEADRLSGSPSLGREAGERSR